LVGQAANGDIASTNYSQDYAPSLIGEETVDGKKCYVLELTAKNKSVSYDRIVYWVSKSLLVGVRADFYTASGKKLKTASFEYENQIEYHGRSFPFISKMTITDAILTNHRTVMEYRDVKVGFIPAAEFNINLLVK
jgi:outer membrane lipoprotein-sorting protein